MCARTVLLLLTLMVYSPYALAADITLVKHARRVTQKGSSQYVVQEGDTLRRILMETYNAKEEDLPALYRRFRQDNPNIDNLDYIPAGTSVVISLAGAPPAAAEKKKTPKELELLDVAPEEYVIKQGEHLARIMRRVYGVSDELIFNEYMNLVKKMNPEITDPNLIRTGQKLKLPGVKQVLAKAKGPRGTTAAALPATSSATTAGLKPQEETKKRPDIPAESSKTPEEIRAAEAAKPQTGQGITETAQAPTEKTSAPVQPSGNSKTSGSGYASDLRAVKGSVLPALKGMGGTTRDNGMYYMPTSGGTSLSINTTEIPVMELDTGKKIIFDMNGTISPEVKAYIEKAFPSFTVITGSQGDLEALMDKVLSVSGYFSINKDSSPLLVGAEEKLRFYGKWIVYKDFSRKNVYVINLLDMNDLKTPGSIRSYARHFGIDLIEIGGKESSSVLKKSQQVTDLKRSYSALFSRLKVPFEANKEIDLVKSGVVKISYKAPMLVGNRILTDVPPDQEMSAMLREKSYELVNTATMKPEEVLKAIGLEFEGPPLKMAVARGRTELELPGLSLGENILLLKRVDKDIATYMAASGLKVLLW